MSTKPLTLENGKYWATCRERTVFAATANGYGDVFPGAEVIVKDGWATFTRDGVEVWNCSARYAAAHFDVQTA
ncbi:hypothetical protein E2P84_06745 [Burkholderia cepacia]|uniref:Uncharacterized protein n=1 Tax=Burkholderia cepacia TaxID=292 RepID=A0AAQ2BQV0_BURCE|nr:MULTISPECIES: hypothetical protein [Burkholderia]ASE92745.1 hypothetical protein CEQ23_03835 [Burkholderia cepacia]ATF80231.1 hypothetical protein CO711_22940 [Burkholderia cepacia]MCA7891718.1 hypothetical protein [Burkholderia cepacia]MCA7901533.1 hypothetical protein [Burkholderia cepacia]MCA7931363.1 hypothetical protein [Burkholderia cepacia]